jgi:signal peptidase II
MRKWTLLAVVASLVFVGDQASKFWAVKHLTLLFESVNARALPDQVLAFVEQRDLLQRGLDKPPVRVLDSMWQWRYTQNRAAAFGMLSFVPESVRVGLFHLITLAATIFIISYYRQLDEKQLVMRVTLALLLGGALGNGFDRVLHGYVIDFIDWHWFDPAWRNPGLHWPTFNVADSAVSVGMVLLLLHSFFARHPSTSPQA